MKSILFLFFLSPALVWAQSGLRAPASSGNDLKLWQETNPTIIDKRALPTLLDCQNNALSIPEANPKRDQIIGGCLQPAIGKALGSELEYERCHAIVRLVYNSNLKAQYRKACEQDLRFYKCEADASKLSEKAKAQKLYKCLVNHASSVPYANCKDLRKRALDLVEKQKIKIEKGFEKIQQSNFCELPTGPTPDPISEPVQR
jgi:hypothetical protein